jgi:hypothetical protein
MIRFWQAVGIFCVTIQVVSAEEPAKPFVWDPPKVRVSSFSNDLGLLDTEREEYATTLATIASNRLVAAKASPAALAEARRMLSLAMQLSPRNKRALVVNFQLTKGILPAIAECNYSPEVFARLIVTRGQLLDKQGGEENKQLARYFIQLAAELDPKNEDAVYLSEVQRLDGGNADWSALSDPKEKKD